MEIMEKTIRFFKINDGVNAGWYADVPGHTLEENQMVSGSDTFLEKVQNSEHDHPVSRQKIQ